MICGQVLRVQQALGQSLARSHTSAVTKCGRMLARPGHYGRPLSFRVFAGQILGWVLIVGTSNAATLFLVGRYSVLLSTVEVSFPLVAPQTS